jgi:hypothetical protein
MPKAIRNASFSTIASNAPTVGPSNTCMPPAIAAKTLPGSPLDHRLTILCGSTLVDDTGCVDDTGSSTTPAHRRHRLRHALAKRRNGRRSGLRPVLPRDHDEHAVAVRRRPRRDVCDQHRHEVTTRPRTAALRALRAEGAIPSRRQ